MMRRIVFIISFIPSLLIAQKAEDVLSKAINYHDPNGNWSALKSNLFFRETRPDGPDRMTTVYINNGIGVVEIDRKGEEGYKVTGNDVTVLSGDKGQERGLTLRNYYLYLWGLPMKLNDESTPALAYVGEDKVEEKKVEVLKVMYEKDTWYFSFDSESGRMLQYKFYKDEAAGKGELIKLENEIVVNGIKIPQSRSWYTLPEMKYLGTDILERGE